MKYCMLLWPHANARYQNESIRLAECELRLMLDVFEPRAQISRAASLDLPAILIDLPDEMSGALKACIARHSLMYGLFESREDGLLRPVGGRAPAFVGSDLPGILKYKGKTNELFLQLLINAALMSSDFARVGEQRLELLDPMCGRGTTLFVAANYGWNASGTDIDRGDLAEAEKFLKRYFEFHRMKHALNRESRTTPEGGVSLMTFSFGRTPEAYKAGDVSLLRLANVDAARTRAVFGRGKAHVIACDLPYGVQHAAVGARPEQLLKKVLPAWRETLKRGGTAAISFNAQTLKARTVRELMAEAGFEVMRGGAYDGFEHWVEQAVTRDIVIGRRAD